MATKKQEESIPAVVLVSRPGNEIVVQVRDAAHLAALKQEHGAENVRPLD